MEETRYGLRVEVALPYDQALTRATEALKAEGFGVLTTIDVQQTLKQKLDKDFRKYTILGACNPPLAERPSPPSVSSARTASCGRSPERPTSGCVGHWPRSKSHGTESPHPERA